MGFKLKKALKNVVSIAAAPFTAGASLAGLDVKHLTSSIGNLMNTATGANAQMQFASEEAQKQRDWEQMMSSTAMQRGVADANAAGLNANMLYGGGMGGASTPTGSNATASSGSGDPIGMISSLINAMSNNKIAEATAENLNADTQNKEKEGGKIQAETMYTLENIGKVEADIKEIISRTNLNEAEKRNAEATLQKMYGEMELINEKIRIAKAEGDIAKVKAQFAMAVEIQQQITGYINSITGIIGAIKGTSALPLNMNSNSNSVNWFGATNNHSSLHL